MQSIEGNIYDYPKYYDLVFGADWKAELSFLRACFDRFARREVWRVFEPACGTGRLLYRLGKSGFRVAGLDLNPKAVDYCNKRLRRHGLPASVTVGDMSDFRVRGKFDAAMNLINSFRHLATEAAALGHLRSVAASLSSGGIYVLGLHLTPAHPPAVTEEDWSARRGTLHVSTRLKTTHLDRRRRREQVQMSLDVHTPGGSRRFVDDWTFRTYSALQMRRLLARVTALELVETFDFSHDIEEPVVVTPSAEDVIYVLRRR